MAADPASHPHLAVYPNGQVGVSEDLLRLDRALDAKLASWANARRAIEHRFPPIVPAAELEKISYLSSFPHLATFPVALARDDAGIAGFVETRGRADALHLGALAPVADVLTPAACYHVYIHYQGRALAAPLYVSTRATCFRREDHYVPLERLWSFSMRELVCIGTAGEVNAFLEAERAVVDTYARSLGLDVAWADATDPFFRPASNPKHLAQRLDPVKAELVFAGRLALASVNFHRNYFGEAFAITRNGQPAFSGCVAFGIERWISAVISTFGPSPEGWPAELAA
jgi:hypothetical protein